MPPQPPAPEPAPDPKHSPLGAPEHTVHIPLSVNGQATSLDITSATQIQLEAKRFGDHLNLSEPLRTQLGQSAEETGRRLAAYASGHSRITLRARGPELSVEWAAAELRHTPSPNSPNSPLRRTTLPPIYSSQGGGGEKRVQGAGWRWLGAPSGTATLLTRPHPRETMIGDQALVSRRDRCLRLAVADGLGHGPAAHEAARRAIQAIEESWALDLTGAVLRAHERTAETRGATLGLLEIDLATRMVHGTTVGNVRVVLFFGGHRSWSPCGTDAVLGHGRGGQHGRLDVRIESHSLPADGMLALFSDGLSNQLRPAWARPLGEQTEQALQLFSDFSGTNDDATLLVFSPGQD